MTVTMAMAMAIAKTVKTTATERGPGLWDRMTLLLCYCLLCYNKGDNNNDSSLIIINIVSRELKLELLRPSGGDAVVALKMSTSSQSVH